MTSSRGISFRDKFRHLYERGYSISAICTLCRVSRGMATDILAHNGYPDAAEHHPNPIVETVEAAKKRRAIGQVDGDYVAKARPVVARLDPMQRCWCAQCDRNVLIAEARQCARAFCKADVEAQG
jgi:hypothetical protein